MLEDIQTNNHQIDAIIESLLLPECLVGLILGYFTALARVNSITKAARYIYGYKMLINSNSHLMSIQVGFWPTIPAILGGLRWYIGGREFIGRGEPVAKSVDYWGALLSGDDEAIILALRTMLTSMRIKQIDEYVAEARLGLEKHRQELVSPPG